VPTFPNPFTPNNPDPRARVVAIAQNELGAQNPVKYWEEVLPPEKQGRGFSGAWCGGFALWCLRQAGIAQQTDWQIGKGFCFNLPRTASPLPGDIAYIDQPFQHHAIVVSANGDSIRTIDGNQAGSTVQERTRKRGQITAFFSIDPLLLQTSNA
jgi:hypothetical protein